MQEGDGAELVAGTGARTRALQRGADGAQQNADHGAGEPGVVRKERPDPLRQGEYPLAGGQRRQDVVGDWAATSTMRRALQEGQTPRPLAGEGDEALGGAGVSADAGEAVGQDAAAQVGEEVVFDPAGHALAAGIGFGGLGKEGLEGVLYEG